MYIVQLRFAYFLLEQGEVRFWTGWRSWDRCSVSCGL